MSASQTPDPQTDAALAAAYQRGDERAATELVRRHAGAVGRFLYSSGAAPAEVDDLVQETFFRAFRGLSGWRGEASLRSWLFTIGGNLLRDEFRKSRAGSCYRWKTGTWPITPTRTPTWRLLKPKRGSVRA